MWSKRGLVVDPERNTFWSRKDGMKRYTWSFNSKRPSSHRIIAATAQIGLVMEAMRKMASSPSGFFDSMSANP